MTKIMRVDEMVHREFLMELNYDDVKMQIVEVGIYDNSIKLDIKDGEFLESFDAFIEKTTSLIERGFHYSIEIDKKEENCYVAVYLDEEGSAVCEIAFRFVLFNPSAADELNKWLGYKYPTV